MDTQRPGARPGSYDDEGFQYPIDSIEVNEHVFKADEVAYGSIHHDVNQAQVTLTLVNVHEVKVNYQHLSEKARPDAP